MPLVHSTNYKLKLLSFYLTFFVCGLAHRKKGKNTRFLPVRCAVLKAAR